MSVQKRFYKPKKEETEFAGPAEPSKANEMQAAAFKEVADVLKSLKDESGKSIDEMGVIHSLGIDVTTGTVSIKLNLT